MKNSDVSDVMARVVTALAKGARARPSRTVVIVSDATRDEVGIGALRGRANLQIEFHSGSDRPVIGPAIRFSKRAMRRVVRWYVGPIAEQQSAINQGLLAVDEKILSEHERLATEVVHVRDQALRLESMLDSLQADISEVALRDGAATADPESVDLLRSSQRLLKYSAFEDRHRGSAEDMRALLSPYVSYFGACRNVLDLGCGRGEFLSLLAEEGITGYGVDSDESMIAACEERGVKAVLEDGIAHLRSLEPGSIDGIFCSQVAEHLTTNQLLQTIDLAYRKVAPGGVVVMETPNPETLAILAYFFYVDLTHIKPIHPEALKWAHEAAGFTDVTILRSSPVPEGTRLEHVAAPAGGAADAVDTAEWAAVNRNVDRLNTLLYGPQHYATIARRPEEIA